MTIPRNDPMNGEAMPAGGVDGGLLSDGGQGVRIADSAQRPHERQGGAGGRRG
jgi:hypothetical protein